MTNFFSRLVLAKYFTTVTSVFTLLYMSCKYELRDIRTWSISHIAEKVRSDLCGVEASVFDETVISAVCGLCLALIKN